MRRFGIYSWLIVILAGLLVGAAWAAPLRQANLFQLFLANTQADLNLLADLVFGEALPPEWTQNEDLASPTFPVDLWVNNELIANAVFEGSTRPDDWFGATSANPGILGRNVRHDLEIIADRYFGDARTRPEGWTGDRPVYRCSRSLQNVLRILDTVYNVRATTPDSVVDFCGSATDEIRDTLFPPIIENSEVAAQTPELLSGVRGDLERLVDEKLGLNSRPPGWSGNRDATTPTFLDDLVRDLEAFADSQQGTGNRPPGWARTVAEAPYLNYFSLRYNLELLSDLTLSEGTRPTGWQGVNPADRCALPVRTLVFLVEQTVAPVPMPAEIVDDELFCNQIERDASNLTENPPVLDEETIVENSLLAQSRLAFTYLDVSALDYMGIMPLDTEFRAWYRNFNESDMMFVSGEGFALFLDRRWTTLSENVFRNLPSLEGRKPLTFCDANWCNGPGPTPTPTGDGPLVLLLSESTPEPTRSVDDLQDQGKRLVSWNNIRVNYLLDRPETNTVQVTLEICSDPTQVACEPVLTVFDTTTGTQRPIISQFNGLNVYELPYGYNPNFILEGTTLFSRDVWISDPTVRG
ncbi:MAG: hypothetical protein H7X77_01615 [Anaerolineae bacterium]|nr:hypothetical protein [Anaerolineae bacterium]